MTKRTAAVPETVAAIPLPSADLLNYRLDQTDKKIDDLSAKIDSALGSFLTKEEALMVRQQYDLKLAEIRHDLKQQATLLDMLRSENDQLKGAVKLLKGVLAVLTALAAILGALWWVRG